MTQLVGWEVARYASRAGVKDADLRIAVAIAWAESGLRTDAVGHNGPTQGCPNGSRDRGLWQINDCYHADVSDACAFDPACNAGAMFRISSGGTNWRPWSTYNNLDYRGYLTAADAAVAAYEGGLTTPGGITNVPYNYTGGNDPIAIAARMIEQGAQPWRAGVWLINNHLNGIAAFRYGVRDPDIHATNGIFE